MATKQVEAAGSSSSGSVQEHSLEGCRSGEEKMAPAAVAVAGSSSSTSIGGGGGDGEASAGVSGEEPDPDHDHDEFEMTLSQLAKFPGLRTRSQSKATMRTENV